MSYEAALAQIGAVEATVSADHIRNSIRTYFNSYPAKGMEDVRTRAALFADNVIFEDPVGAEPKVGIGVLTEFFKATVDAGWSITMQAQKIIVCGNEAITLTLATWGKPGTQPAKAQSVHNFIFDDAGKIARMRYFFDAGCVS